MFALSNRTPTAHQQVFNLQDPHPVIFDFSRLATDGLLITIPPRSAWTSRRYWHFTPEACEEMWLVSGHHWYGSGFVTSPGSGVGGGGPPGSRLLTMVPKMWIVWKRDTIRAAYANEALEVALRFPSPQNHEMYRQICSVQQDAEVYFHLATTPFWLRVTYALWKNIPFVGKYITERLVAWCLWVQLRVIYAKSDYWTYEGKIPYTLPWHLRNLFDNRPPPHLVEKELKSVITISRRVRKSCYWVGTNLLGMKASYEEYRAASFNQGDPLSDNEKQPLIDL